MPRIVVLWLVPLLVAHAAQAQSREERQKSVRWLQSLQTPDGGFRPSPDAPEQGSLRATSAAVRALKRFGGEPVRPDAVSRFVEQCWHAKTRTFGDRPGQPGDVILTAVGLMAVRELGLPMDNYRQPALDYLAENAREYEEIRMAAAGMEAAGKVPPDAARRWLEQLRSMAQPDGSFGSGVQKARLTGGTVVAILRLGGDGFDPHAIIQLLNKCQNSDGAFGHDERLGSDLETTYRVVRCYSMLKTRPARADNLRNWVAQCRHVDGGYGIRPGQPPTVGATYFAAMVLDWLTSR